MANPLVKMLKQRKVKRPGSVTTPYLFVNPWATNSLHKHHKEELNLKLDLGVKVARVSFPSHSVFERKAQEMREFLALNPVPEDLFE